MSPMRKNSKVQKSLLTILQNHLINSKYNSKKLVFELLSTTVNANQNNNQLANNCKSDILLNDFVFAYLYIDYLTLFNDSVTGFSFNEKYNLPQ